MDRRSVTPPTTGPCKKAARQVCEVCPIQYSCLPVAMNSSYVDGIYKGLIHMERKEPAQLI
ncbi:WhiB family transcriptional regulator [Bifidobacterium sp. B3998]|uniref:WhiB family transcriptional regulator n=1 Tax=unclassified Bifidobacterium TaxID=2608897 RepID=UPI003A5CADC3